MQKNIIRAVGAAANNAFLEPSLKTTVSEAEYGLIGFIQTGNLPPLPFSDPDNLADIPADFTPAEIEEEQSLWRAAQKELCEALRGYIERVSSI